MSIYNILDAPHYKAVHSMAHRLYIELGDPSNNDNEEHLVNLGKRAGLLVFAFATDDGPPDDVLAYDILKVTAYCVYWAHGWLNWTEIWESMNVQRGIQVEKFGTNRNLERKRYYRIMQEEIGEIARAIEDEDWDNLLTEIIQVATVGVCWVQKG